MIDTIQFLSALGGLIALGITLFASVIGAIYVTRSKVSEKANAAQQSAIDAMKAELETLRGRIDDLNKENVRLEKVVDTICQALKVKGTIITIQGEMVHIRDNGNSTSKHI